MTDVQIKELIINHGDLRPLKEIMKETEDFIRCFSSMPLRLQEVGAVRRGEDEVRAIELLIIAPYKSWHDRFVRTLHAHCDNVNITRPDAWTMTYYGIPVVIWIATKETFVENQLIRTGPPCFVEIVTQAAEKRHFILDRNGFRKGRTLLMPSSEADILELVGLPYVPPQERAAFVQNVEGDVNG